MSNEQIIPENQTFGDAKATPEVIPEVALESQSNANLEATPEAAPPVVPQVATPIVTPVVPEVIPKVPPKVSPEVVVSEVAPEVTPNPVPNPTPNPAAPKAIPTVAPNAMAMAMSSATPKATPKAAPKAAPKAMPNSASKGHARRIVVTSGKGGVGKTTLTANLGMALAKQNKKVALVDADFGLRNLDLLLGLENRVVYTAVEVIAGVCRLDQALVKDKRQPGLALLPAAQNRNKEAVSPEQMSQLLDELAKSYDYILIDCPAGIEQGFQNAIAGAREALIVTTPEIAAVRDADRVVGLLESQSIKPIRLIVNRLRPAMVKANNMMSVEDVQEILAIPLIGVVPDDEKVIISSNRGEPLVLTDKENPSLPSIAITHIARRLEGEQIPLIDLMAYHDGLLNRIKRFFLT